MLKLVVHIVTTGLHRIYLVSSCTEGDWKKLAAVLTADDEGSRMTEGPEPHTHRQYVVTIRLSGTPPSYLPTAQEGGLNPLQLYWIKTTFHLLFPIYRSFPAYTKIQSLFLVIYQIELLNSHQSVSPVVYTGSPAFDLRKRDQILLTWCVVFLYQSTIILLNKVKLSLFKTSTHIVKKVVNLHSF